MIRAVLFDLDGTLVDSYEAIAEGVNHALRRLGLPLRTSQEVRGMVGGGVHEVIRKAAGEDYIAEGVRLFRERYAAICRERTCPLPGALDALEELRRRGYRLGVATNKPGDFARRILDHLGMARYLDAVLGPEDVARPKPDPAMLLRLAETLGVEPAEAVYVGDMPIDAVTARAAGMAVWLVPTGSASRDEVRRAAPDRLIESLAELTAGMPVRTG